MKKIVLMALCLLPLAAMARKQASPEFWQNPGVFEENRMPMRATFVTDQQKTLSLNGVWKFHWSETPADRTAGFEEVDFDDASWDTMPVPGMWELNGFGDPVYVNVGYPWRGHFDTNPPAVPTEGNHVGQYRRTFTLTKDWTGRQVCLHIGSATSNVRVWVNGKKVGYSQDSKLEARFDLTPYVRPGENVIALEIFRWCDGTYLEDQDFWRLSGIARGVYLFTREKERIEDVHILAGMDGKFRIETETTPGIKKLSFTVKDASGKVVASQTAVPAKGKAVAEGAVASPALWSAETPHLYTLSVEASTKKGLAESTSLEFGFRTVEIRDRQLLVNGKAVLIKGVDRHELNEHRGYVLSEADMLRDIRVMKELNVNAVRTSHYPNDPLWYTLCDRYGIYVVDEGNIESHGMGYDPARTLANREDFREAHLARDRRMVQRDFNHPSIIVWSMGNEAGNGTNFYACYDMIKAMDPSRPVMYERGQDDVDSDIKCPMYMTPADCEAYAKNGSKPLIQCEYAHAMGNSMGNFKEYWDLVRKYPSYQGGFIWDFMDQALVKPVSAGGTDHIFAFGGDYNDDDASDGSFNCNGVIAADRSLHPHAYEVRYQYRNILTSLADGALLVKNEHFFKDLSAYRMEWTLFVEGEAVRSGARDMEAVVPGASVRMALPWGTTLPACSAGKDVYANVRFVLKEADGLLPAGFEVAYDQVFLQETAPQAFAGSASVVPDSSRPFTCSRRGNDYVFSGVVGYPGVGADRSVDWSAVFDGATGFLTSYRVGGVEQLREPLTPEFSRAPVENDLGARSHLTMGVWRYPQFALNSLTASESEGRTVLKAEYAPIADGRAAVVLEYCVRADGSIVVTESMKDAGGLAEAPDLFRFGMKLAMPGAFSTVDFYGKGPWENYSDRNSAALVGRYVQSVNEQYHYGYVRTQESGTKTGLKYFRVLDASGNGIEFTADVKFSASALPFSIRDLDCFSDGTPVRKNRTNVQAGAARHSLSLKEKAHENDRAAGTTYVNVDLVQMGVAGIDSWHHLPLEPYRIHAGERTFRFVIRPVRG